MALGTKVGDIFLDLNLNQKGFNTQLNGISKIAGAAGKTIAKVFAVKELIKFGKERVNLGSDLAEVQNVVDVAFPTMSKQIDNFATGAAKNFGLSETMAKRFSGTFGSMGTAFGFTEKQAANMATTLTGLAGDIASFYNISQDEAYTKLKSVFTGETESLKDLGVVMTQSALDAFALANGFGKTTKSMTEAEKVALRYAFVQNQLTNAAGDFARTSDFWANQVRILSLNFDTLKASIGEGLINVLKPVVKWLNAIIERLIVAAKAFAEFTSAFSRKNTESVSNNLNEAVLSADNLSSSSAKTADNLTSAGAAAKELKRTLAGFDQITKVTENSDSTMSSTGSAVDLGTFNQIDSTLTGTTKVAEETQTKLNGVLQFIADMFNWAFKPYLDNAEGIAQAFDNIGKIGKRLFEIIFKKDYEEGWLHNFLTKWTQDNTDHVRKKLEKLNDALEVAADILSGDITMGEAFKTIFDLITGKLNKEQEVTFRTTFEGRTGGSFKNSKKEYESVDDDTAIKTVEGLKTDTFKDTKTNYDSVKNNTASKTVKGIFGDNFSNVKSNFDSIYNSSATKTITGVKASGFDIIKSRYDSIRSKTATLSLTFSAAANDLKSWINTNVIDRANNALHKVPILQNVNIPHLAQGGYVKANTPQLAVIGDNRHQGEIVSPEDKLIEMARTAAAMSGGGRDAEIVSLLRQILTHLGNLNLTATVDAVALKKLIVRLINENTQSTGVCEIYI